MKQIDKQRWAPVSCACMFQVVNDIEHYPTFLKGCLAAQVIESKPTCKTATLTLGKASLNYVFTTQNHLDPPHSMDLRLVEGAFSDFRGSWAFEPKQQGCQVCFRLHFALSGLKGQLAEPIIKEVADGMVDAFIQRAIQVCA